MKIVHTSLCMFQYLYKFFHRVVSISSWQAAVIIYYSEDTYNVTGTVMANISVTNTPTGGQSSNYRPQTKFCEGYGFTRVCHSVHSGGCLVPGQGGGWGIWPGGLSRPTPRGEVGGSGQGGV